MFDEKRGLPWEWGDSVLTGISASRDRTSEPGERLAVRAVRSNASPDALWLWLCQLRRAPYSYDWIDNFGKRSPRVPEPAMLELEIGQKVMTIFTLTAFDPGVSMTLRIDPGWSTRVFGAITVTYNIVRVSESESVLRAILGMPRIPVLFGGFGRYMLAWGDLIMMRKQLRLLSVLAEQSEMLNEQTAIDEGTS
ncbi:hypothetical protein [Paramicrobacterium chengjingii]|uniref:hypothetical protein n=1 Tax=Paramicrobacterium chengjingii TaxID=2769067 RepID=UPI0014227502|nr:hypothetical protein [Microbacterium chengjingii]